MRIALDLSCLLDPPWTGVAYAAYHQVQALSKCAPELDLRLFGARSRRGLKHIAGLEGTFTRECVLSYARRLKPHVWTRFNWPPIERFCGAVDIAHDMFHQLPAARKAVRMVTIHDLSFICLPETHTKDTVRLQTMLVRHCVRHADALVAVSQSCKSDLIELLGAPPERIHVVPNGVRLEDFQEPIDSARAIELRRRLGLEGLYWIHLGTIEARKNIPRLLEAYARVRATRHDAPKLLLAGKVGWRAEPVFERLEALRLEDAVVQTGHLAREDAIQLLREAHACVYPSLYEGFGLPALEAMAAGVPVLTSNVSALPEVAGDTAVLVDPNRVESIEEGLHTLLDDASGCATRVAAAKQRASGMTWERSAQRLLDVYQRVLSNG